MRGRQYDYNSSHMSDVTLPLAEIKKRLSEIVDGIEERHTVWY